MSTPQITVRHGIAAFVATRIEAARFARHPVPRCAVPTSLRRDSVAPDGSTAVFFWVQRRTLLQAGANRSVVAASKPSIADAVTSPGTVAVGVNAGAAAMSSRVVVLTAALARKLYMAGDPGDIRA